MLYPVFSWWEHCEKSSTPQLNNLYELLLCYKQDMEELMRTDRPDWQSVMLYVSKIYKYFETW